MKNQKGITLTSLVIAVVVILILVSVGTNIGINNIKDSRDSAVKTELKLIQQAVLQRYTKYNLTKDPNILPGQPYSEENFEDVNKTIAEISLQTKVLIKLKDDIASNYYLLDTSSLEELGITNTEDEYIVNYITGEVINKTQLVTSESKEALYIYGRNSE